MSDDEEATLRTLKGHREVIDGLIDKHHGRTFNTAGDSVLAEFGSTVEAVRCAISIQEELRVHNAELADDRQMHFRIGVNVGDVMVEGDNLYGDGVNIAARLEGVADPGGICISGSAFDQVKDRLSIGFEDIGPQEVKNIDRPVQAYRVDLGSAAPIESTASQKHTKPPSSADKPSIAVLPFDNLSDDPQQEYFSDGMAEDLITDISNISGLFVIARNSSFAFKGQAIDVKEVAEKLGVKHILEGSVRKMGTKLRVNAQLIDAATGGHLWAARYDGDMENIFEFQDNIREQIVSALQVSLTPTDRTLTERKPTDSVEAYDLFLKGRANFNRVTYEDNLEAINCFEAAIEIDPHFGDAYGSLAFCHYFGWSQMFPGFDNGLDRANELAEKGVALDSTSAIAHSRLGWTQAFLRRYDEAVANSEKALVLAPNNAEVYALFGTVLNFWGNPERGLEMLEKAFSIETFAPPVSDFQVGISHYLLRHYDQALAAFNRMAERAPKFYAAYMFLACTYVELDRLDDARDAIKTFLEIVPRYTVKETARRVPWRIDEVRDRFLNNLRKAELPEG
jgi:adenylate cyclase